MVRKPSTSVSSIIAPPSFVPRGRMTGLHWVCAYSGHVNHTSITSTANRLYCRCGRHFMPGIVFYPLVAGRGSVRAIPPDWVIPKALTEAFPEGDLAIVPWKRHHPTHVLVDPRSADYNVDLFIKQVRLAAETAQGGAIAPDPSPLALVKLARLGAAFEAAVRGYRGDVNI